MESPAKIRTSKVSDAEAILEIYKPSVLETAASFEVELPSVDEIKRRIEDTLKTFPWLVYEIDGEIVGYAYASAHRSRSAYRWSVESTVYVKNSFHKKGIGRSLYSTLLPLLKTQGVVNVFSGITLPNVSSVTLHESLGYSQIGTFKDVGFKFGKWWDVGWWQLQLQRLACPHELKPFDESNLSSSADQK